MTYFGFLLLFLFTPIFILGTWALAAKKQRRPQKALIVSWPFAAAALLHSLIALIYTTPWDNYLVATRVWWYDPELVTGITIGWVPIEEYTFFVVQPLLASLWLYFLLHHLDRPKSPLKSGVRGPSVIVTLIIWAASLAALISGWSPANYLSLELAWALPPVALQLGFGADILWRYRRLTFLAVIPPTLYLSAADALAIDWGTWTINPQKSLGLLLGGVLPVEELLFFLLTSTLVGFGMVLILAPESHRRLAGLRRQPAGSM